MWKRYSLVNVIDIYKNECINRWCLGSLKDRDCFRVFLVLFEEEGVLLDVIGFYSLVILFIKIRELIFFCYYLFKIFYL